MLIRKAERRDAPAMARYICMAEREMIPFFTGYHDAENAERVLRSLILNDVPNRYSLDNALVAEIDGEAAGSLCLFAADRQPELDLILVAAVNMRGGDFREFFFEGEPGSWYLSTMGVDPKFRGRGAGTALMAAADEEGKRRGFAMASLLVDVEKEKAKALYERLGYRIIRQIEIGSTRYFRMGKQLGSGQGGGGSGVTTPTGA